MKRIIRIITIIITCSLFFYGCSSSGYSKSKYVLEIKNAEHFQQEVLDCPQTVAVMFYTVACPTCREIKPLIADLAEIWKNEIKIVTVNCRISTDLVMKYEIHAVPRFVFFENGQNITEAIQFKGKDELFALFEHHS